MKQVNSLICAAFILSVLITGCSTLQGGPDSSRTSGEESTSKTVALGYEKAFDKVTRILKNNDILIFRSSREKRRIIAMGLRKQVNTTRVIISFDPVSDNNVKVTLSSLSPTALTKAAALIFDNMGV